MNGDISSDSTKKFTPLWLLALVAVGVVAGLGSAGFLALLQASVGACFGHLANYFPVSPGHEGPSVTPAANPGEPVRWLLLLLPAIGGLASGLITFFLAPEVEGHGTDAAISAFHFKDGKVRRRVPLLKAITSALTIGTGGSGGREGPIAQIGSGFGSMLADWLHFPLPMRRTMMAAGMAAGIGAIFHAPMAGALFAAEVMYQGPDMEFELIVPSFITCIVAYSVFALFYGFHPLFVTPAYRFEDPQMLLPYLILALFTAMGAMLYVRAFYGVRGLFFDKLQSIPDHLKPMLGGLATGVVGFFLPEALGTGYGVLQACFNTGSGSPPTVGNLLSYDRVGGILGGMTTDPVILAAVLLGIIALAKIATTAFSIGSGGSGGVFGPAVVIGGSLGAAVGFLCGRIFPGLPVEPGAFAILGMAGFFAGAANTPISTIIMISEMTGNYNLLLPSMFVCVIAYSLCRRFTLYREQLQSRYSAPNKLGLMGRAVLSRVTVGETLARLTSDGVPVLYEDMRASEMVSLYEDSTLAYLPVVDVKGRPVGIVATENIRSLADDLDTQILVIASDLVLRTPFVTRDESLLTVVNMIAEHGVPEMPVVDEKDLSRIIGIIGEKEISAFYGLWFSETEVLGYRESQVG